jgi:hypothetical protein
MSEEVALLAVLILATAGYPALFTGVRGSGILRSSLHSYAPVSPGAEVDCAFI